MTAYSYNDAGQLQTTTYPTGVVETRSYDDAGRLEAITATKAGALLTSFVYTLDNAGMCTAVQRQIRRPDGTLETGAESYGYDDLYRPADGGDLPLWNGLELLLRPGGQPAHEDPARLPRHPGVLTPAR